MQPEALRQAAAALRYWERKQAVTANNLANVNTTGFKGERVFAQLLADNTVNATAAMDERAGAITPTGNPLDLALGGADMLVVQTSGGERLTRGGALRLAGDRTLTDSAGHSILGDGGPIKLPDGKVEIRADGTVLVDNTVIDRLRLERYPAGALQYEGAGAFKPTARGMAVPDAERLVHAGALEESNVSSLDSLVQMIEVQRAYASIQSSMRVVDDVMRTDSNDIGKVQ